MNIVIITGLSGAGKSLAVDCFEDMGYYCIDNLPPSLIQNFIDLIGQGQSRITNAAFVVDIRGGAFFGDLNRSLADLNREEVRYRILFLDADTSVLVRRFGEVRRAHPLSAGRTMAEAIAAEREMMQPLKERADFTIDTSALKSAALIRTIRTLMSDEGETRSFRYTIQSFGFKYGVPLDADTVLDVRFIPNPFYVSELKHRTGNDPAVRAFVMEREESRIFMNQLLDLLNLLKPSYLREGKPDMNIAFGCTGGQHRSVAMANAVAEYLSAAGEDVIINHRDI